MAATFIVSEVSYGVRMRKQPNVRTVKFDEMGYELRSRRGPNSNLQVWDVPFDVCSIQQANNIENFFDAHGGVDWFWWTPPRQTLPRRFVCKEWTREPVNGSRTHDRMTAVFEEVADVA